MYSKYLLSAAAITLALGVAGPSQAQGLGLDLGVGVDIEIGVGAGEGEQEGAGGVDVGIGAGAGADVSAGAEGESESGATTGLFAGMDADARIDAVIGMMAEAGATAFSSVSGAAVYDVNPWLTAETSSELTAAATMYQTGIADLQAAIAANAELAAWLQANNLSIDSIVAAQFVGEGELALIMR